MAKQSGIKIVSSQQYPANPTDLSTQAEKLQAAGADSIIMNSLSESDYTVLFRALSSLNYKVPVIGGSPGPTRGSSRRSRACTRTSLG